MANYDVNIAIALKNSNKLMQLRKELKAATDKQREFNKEAKETNKIAVSTFSKLNAQLSRAKGLLDKAAYGTDSFNRAARALVNVEKEHNHQLKEKERLLNRLRMESDPMFQLKQQRKQQIKENIRQNRALRFTNVNPGRPAVVGDYGQAGGRIGPAQILNTSQGGFAAFSKAATKIQQDTKKIAVSTKKSSQILSQQATAANFGALTGQAQGFLPGSGFGMAGGQIGPRQPLRNRLGFGRNALPGPFAMQGGAMGRVRGGVGSAMIGGGFPLLFGAGGLSSVLGGLAGGIGGALAPGGGFAASIAATAIAAQIEEVRNFRKAVRTLNEEMKAAGAVTQLTRGEIKQLARDLDITNKEAVEVAASFSKFADVKGLDLSRIFGSRELFDATVGLNDVASTLTRIQQLSENLTLEKEFEAYKILSEEGSEAANDFIINSLLAAKQYSRFSERFKEDIKEFQDFGVLNVRGLFSELNEFLSDPIYDEKFQNIIKAFMKNNAEIQKILNDPNSYMDTGEDKVLKSTVSTRIDAILKPILNDTELLKEALQNLPPEFDLSTASAKKLVEALSQNVEKLQFLQEFKAPEEEVKKLLNPMRQVLDLSKEIKIGFEDSFKGIIKGTMSVSDAFRNMLNRIADYFLDTAAQLLALQVQRGFLSLFSNMFTFDVSTDSTSNGLNLADMEKYSKAGGGPVKGGTGYLVGERGPEIFTPGVSGMITPNHMLGGTTNVVVNVDASGSSVEGDEQQGRELGRMISVAIQSELIKQKRPGGMLA